MQKDSQCGCRVVTQSDVGDVKSLEAGGADHAGHRRPSGGARYSSWCSGKLLEVFKQMSDTIGIYRATVERMHYNVLY